MALTPEQQAYFQQWYEQVKRETAEFISKRNLAAREAARQQNDAEPNGRYMPTANLRLDVASEYVSQREYQQQTRRAQVQMMPEEEQEKLRFLLSKSDRLSEQIADAQFDVLVFQNMEDKAKTGPQRAYLQEIRRRSIQAQNRVMADAATYDAFDSVFDHIAGLVPQDCVLISADAYHTLTPEQQEERAYAVVGAGAFNTMLGDAPASLQGMEFEDYLTAPVAQRRLQDTLTMEFKENAEFNSRKFLENMTKAGKQPTLYETDYAISVYETTFSGVFDKEQKARLAEWGMNEFDLIMIGGRSANELFAEKYKDLDPIKRETMMRAEVIAAVMASEQGVAVSRMEMDQNGRLVLSDPAVMKRGGELHDPKPTIGQRFLNFFGIKQYVPLSHKMEAANMPVLDPLTRDPALRKLTEKQEKLDQMVEHKAWQVRFNKLDEANKGPRIAADFQQFFGVNHEDYRNLEGFQQAAVACTLASQLSRPSTGVALVYAKLLRDGHRLADIMDADKLAAEKTAAGAAIEQQMRTPEGTGLALAEATKTFADLNIRQELGYALGRELTTKQDMADAMLSEEGIGVTAPMFRKLYSCTREMQQSVNYLYDYKALSLTETPDVDTRVMLTEEKSPATRKAFDAFCNNMTTQDMQNRHLLWGYDITLMANNRIDILRDYCRSDAYVYGTEFTPPEGTTLEKAAEKAIVIRSLFAEIANNMQDTIASSGYEPSKSSYYAAATRTEQLSQFSAQELTDVIASGTGRNPEKGSEIFRAALNPFDESRIVEQETRNLSNRIGKQKEQMQAKVAAYRIALEAREAQMVHDVEEAAASMPEHAKEAPARLERMNFNVLAEEEIAESGKPERRARSNSMNLGKPVVKTEQKESPDLHKPDEMTRGKK